MGNPAFVHKIKMKEDDKQEKKGNCVDERRGSGSPFRLRGNVFIFFMEGAGRFHGAGDSKGRACMDQ